MCRLMAFAAKDQSTFQSMAGKNFQEFADLASHHCDGWGIATSEENHASLQLDPSSAYKNSKFLEATSNQKHQAALLHLRWATLDLSINEANTHPFTYGEYAFIHNGSINPPASIEKFIAPDIFSTARGDTDSERYFLALVTSIRENSTQAVAESVANVVAEIWQSCSCSSINAMLLTPDELIVISKFNVERRPKGEPENYYNLAYRLDDQGLVVASSGWDQAGWSEIPNHTMAIINRHSLEVATRSI